MRAALATPVLALLIASCGGGTPTVAPTVPVASAPAPPPTPPPEPLDVSALPPPGGLAVTLHIAHPRVVFDKVTSVLGSLSSLLPSLGKVDLDSAVTAAAGAPIGAAVDLDQSMDVAMSDWNGEGGPKIAGSVGLVASPGAREALEKFYKSSETGSGVVRLEPRDDPPEGASPRPCAILPAYGGSARLVCGENEKAVLHLGPYLARTMTRTTSNDDLRVEVFVHALQEGKAASSDDAPKKDKDPGDLLADELVEKLSADVGSVVLEASSRSNALDMKVTSSFVGATSALTRATLGIGTAGSPPALFDRLPHDASFAWYGRGASTADLEPLRGMLVEALRQSSIDDGYSPAVTDELLAPLRQVFLTGGSWAVATGAHLDEAKSALDAYVAGGKTTEAARAKARLARTGWFVAGVDEPAERWMAAARILVKGDEVKPTGKPKRTRDPQKEKWKVALRPVPAGLHLPAGTLHVEAQVTPNPKWAAKRKKDKLSVDPSLPHAFHCFVVPDGSRTWLAGGEDAAIAAAQVLASLGGAPDAGTLASRRDLDALRAMPASTAGFVSVAALVAWRGGETDEELHHARESLLGVASLTNAGTTPVPITFAATPAAGGAAQGGDFGMRVVFPLSLGLEIAASGHSIF
jgi:hypothetical protein